MSYARLSGDSVTQESAGGIRAFVLENAVVDGRFAKYVGSRSVDANLMWLAVPFGMFGLDDLTMLNTLCEVERRLLSQNGVQRYPEDTYYGGGRWVLLSAWLGLCYVELGRIDEAGAIAAWIEEQADERGFLPEQVPVELNAPEYYAPWATRWGPIARPLLWSHAMYLALRHALAAGRVGSPAFSSA